MSYMCQGIRISHPHIMGVCCSARHLGRQHHEIAERVLRTTRYDTSHGVLVGQING